MLNSDKIKSVFAGRREILFIQVFSFQFKSPWLFLSSKISLGVETLGSPLPTFLPSSPLSGRPQSVPPYGTTSFLVTTPTLPSQGDELYKTLVIMKRLPQIP